MRVAPCLITPKSPNKDGVFRARHFEDLSLRESEEMREDRVYLEALVERLQREGLRARARLALGDPATELIKAARDEGVDLLAMATHGHRLVNDLLRGSTVDRVRHELAIPVLLLRRAGGS